MSEIEQETKRRLKNIVEDVNEGRIVTAAFYIKKLAIFLDKRRLGEPLENMMKNEA